jgi:hypothetical protein
VRCNAFNNDRFDNGYTELCATAPDSILDLEVLYVAFLWFYSVPLIPSFDLALSEVQRIHKTKLNSGALVRQRTIPTERPPLIGEVNANFSG